MNCQKYQELISCLIDGELSDTEITELENHIASCPECKAMYEDFAALSGIMESSMAEVPDSLHEKIMSGVKSAAVKKSKKPLIIRLRPYMAAAACLVVVVGAVFALRDGAGLDMAANSTAAAAPGAAADFSMPADAPAESEKVDYGYSSGTTESAEDSVVADEVTTDASPEAPRDDAPDMPAEEPSANFGVQDNGVIRYIPGSSIDSATLTTLLTDGSSKATQLRDLEALIKALVPMDFSDEVDFVTSAVLELVCGAEVYTLELYYAGEALIVRQNGEYYFASATVQEFLAIK